MNMKNLYLMLLVTLLASCSKIIERNVEYEKNLPYRFIIIDIEREAKGEMPFTKPSWKSYWGEEIQRLKNQEMNDHVSFLIHERRKRGLPEL
jgi:hypothetical protein